MSLLSVIVLICTGVGSWVVTGWVLERLFGPHTATVKLASDSHGWHATFRVGRHRAARAWPLECPIAQVLEEIQAEIRDLRSAR